jgi:hypothetical protein
LSFRQAQAKASEKTGFWFVRTFQHKC